MKVWITKYALTDGILEKDGQLSEDGKYVSSQNGIWPSSPRYFFCRMNRDAFATPGEAEARVRDMCERKLKSLEKSREKILEVLKAHGGHIG